MRKLFLNWRTFALFRECKILTSKEFKAKTYVGIVSLAQGHFGLK